ncbi:MAG: substrate-binding domain-containing protein [Lentisphaeria bacterium]|nr:substrate-binding domain-containing protein [Lentisphaeria bacterium]
MNKIPTKKYEQVASKLRDEIQSLEVGKKLPTEASYLERLGCARNTLRSAMDLLRQEGLIVSQAGAGTFRAQPTETPAHIHQIQVIMPSRQERFWYDVMNGINDELQQKKNYQLIYSHGETIEEIQKIIHQAELAGVSGIILLALYSADTLQELNIDQHPIPIITVHNKIKNSQASFVGSQEKEPIAALAQLMIQANCQQISFLGGADCSSHKLRQKAYIRAMDKNNLDIQLYRIGTTHQEAYEFMKSRWFGKMSKGIHGIIATNDYVAAGVVQACHEEGWRIPEDLCLSGFGNIQEAFLTVGRLITTVDQAPDELGKQALKALFKEINGEVVAGQEHFLPVQVIHHNSIRNEA